MARLRGTILVAAMFAAAMPLVVRRRQLRKPQRNSKHQRRVPSSSCRSRRSRAR